MAWSARVCEGFLVAATVAGDRNAAIAATGLGGSAATAVHALLGTLQRSTAHERRELIAQLVENTRAPIAATQQPMPKRALAVIALLAERNLGRQWLAQAPMPRAGFVAEPGLRALLREIAEHGTWHA